MRIVVTAVILMALWLAMSGIYKPMLIGLGVASVVLVLVIIRRMDTADGDRLDIRLRPLGLLAYFLWLMVEIAKANWAVTKIVLSPGMKMRQHMFRVPHSQKSDLGQVIYANSITLTPGTITVGVDGQELNIHALTQEGADDLKDGGMDRRVCQFEGSS